MWRIGIDLGGTKIEGIALDPQGREHWRQRVATPQGDYTATVRAIAQLVNRCETALQQHCHVGIGIPGTLCADSGLVKNANSTCLIGQPLDLDLEKILERPVRISNDADCFTLSEATDGAGQGSASVFGVILGTGVGGGLMIHGALLRGPNGITGEWGHNPLPWRDSQDDPVSTCYCGQQGCIETYLSGPGFCHQYQSRSGLAVNDVTALMARVSQGETAAIQSLECYCRQLAKSLAMVINIVDPQCIVLGGGLSNIRALYEQVPILWHDYVFSNSVHTRLLQARHGDTSGVRGAAWLWQRS